MDASVHEAKGTATADFHAVDQYGNTSTWQVKFARYGGQWLMAAAMLTDSRPADSVPAEDAIFQHFVGDWHTQGVLLKLRSDYTGTISSADGMKADVQFKDSSGQVAGTITSIVNPIPEKGFREGNTFTVSTGPTATSLKFTLNGNPRNQNFCLDGTADPTYACGP